MAHLLISKDCLKKQQEKRNKRRFVIVITVSNKIEVKWLLVNDLYFGGAIKNIEKY